ncbi:hypothetical protein EON63_07920 [archaeon]|nr:MAG: hypothetical protein EON63_07920 [archaeon]
MLQISMAYEARSHFPEKTLHITNEIIHNPQVGLHGFDKSIDYVCVLECGVMCMRKFIPIRIYSHT